MSGRIRAEGRDLNHRHPRRTRLVRVRLGEDEYADVAAAARASGVTPTGYTAEVALAAARGSAQRSQGTDIAVLRELIAALSQLRRCGNNINQAARILNGNGEEPAWLQDAVAITNRVVDQVDQALSHLGPRCR